MGNKNEENDRNGFTFYRSFFEVLDKLPVKKSSVLYKAICNYALNGIEPELPSELEGYWILMKPALENGVNRAKAGKKGGSKPKANVKQTESKTEANEKQTPSEEEEEEEVEVEVEEGRGSGSGSGSGSKEDEVESSIGEKAHLVCAKSPIPYADVVDAYNAICTSYPRITGELSKKRKDAIRARFNCGRTMNDFLTVFHKAQASNFLKGANDRNWSAKFDWLIQDGNFAKVLDGNYDNRAAPGMANSEIDSYSAGIIDWAERSMNERT